jgi:hypothetical protein
MLRCNVMSIHNGERDYPSLPANGKEREEGNSIVVNPETLYEDGLHRPSLPGVWLLGTWEKGAVRLRVYHMVGIYPHLLLQAPMLDVTM